MTTLVSRLKSFWRELRRPDQNAREMDDEMRFHVEMEGERLVRERGLSHAEARRQAAISFGGQSKYEEAARDVRRVAWAGDGWRDIRIACRALLKRRAYAVTSILTLSIGIGAVTAIYTLVHSILLTPLPYREPDRLIALRHAAPGVGTEEVGVSSGLYMHYRDHATSFEALAVFDEGSSNLSDDATEVERVNVAYVAPDFFEVLGVAPALGRMFTPEDWAPAASGNMSVQLPILLSHDLWQRRYGGDPSIIGKTVDLGSPRQIVGVMPAGFAFPDRETHVWMLVYADTWGGNFAQDLNYGAIARLRAGVTPEMAAEELRQVLPTVIGSFTDATVERFQELRLSPLVTPLGEYMARDVAHLLWILFGGMVFLLFVACASVANLFLARLEQRKREFVVRSALGASTVQLGRSLLAESCLLFGVSAAVGIWLASVSSRALSWLAPALPRLEEVRMTLPVAAFGVATAASLCLALSIVGMMKIRANRDLTAPGAPRSIGGAHDETRTRSLIVGTQIAVTFALLIASGLMIRSFLELTDVQERFDPENLATIEVGIPQDRWQDITTIFPNLEDVIAEVPGVSAVAAVSSPPLVTSSRYPTAVRRADVPSPPETDVETPLKFFTPGYFKVIGTTLIDGERLDDGPPAGVKNPVLLSQHLATRLFGGESAVGKTVHQLEYGSVSTFRSPLTVVGVVADLPVESMRNPAFETVYVPIVEPAVETSMVPLTMTYAMRSSAPLESLSPLIRQAVLQAEPNVSLGPIQTMESVISMSAASERLLTTLLTFGAAIALFLTAVGVFGIITYTVGQKTGEIGLRIGLGASYPQILSLTLHPMLKLAMAAAVTGLIAALLAGRLLQSFLFGVGSADLPTILAAVAVLSLVAATAAVIPATRAARLQPAEALRSE